MVNRMFTKCLDSKTLRQVIGIAIECRRFDVVETAIAQSPNTNDTLAYCMHVSLFTIFYLYPVLRSLKTLSLRENSEKKSSDFWSLSIPSSQLQTISLSVSVSFSSMTPPWSPILFETFWLKMHSWHIRSALSSTRTLPKDF